MAENQVNRSAYIHQYKMAHYKRVVLELHKDYYSEIENIAEEKGLTPNNYIRELIKKDVDKYKRAKRKEK